MRAVTIPIDNLAAVGGSTVEGSFVDVLFRAKARSADPVSGRPEIPATTVTLLENVEVLAVDRVNVAARNQNMDGIDLRNRPQQGPVGGSNYSGNPVVSVTIAVSPDQANVIKAVSGQGDMSLALRSEKGAGTVSPNKYTLEEIMGVKQTASNMNRIEIFRGGQQRQYVSYTNGKRTGDEVSVIPGVAPSTRFPVPAKLPTPVDASPDVKDQAPTYPQPYMYQGYGNGYGNGWGWGNGNYMNTYSNVFGS
jgi:Flp pilus assembly protein CpaB